VPARMRPNASRPESSAPAPGLTAGVTPARMAANHGFYLFGVLYRSRRLAPGWPVVLMVQGLDGNQTSPFVAAPATTPKPLGPRLARICWTCCRWGWRWPAMWCRRAASGRSFAYFVGDPPCSSQDVHLRGLPIRLARSSPSDTSPAHPLQARSPLESCRTPAAVVSRLRPPADSGLPSAMGLATGC